jgi:hypothetical protein
MGIFAHLFQLPRQGQGTGVLKHILSMEAELS